MPAVVLDARMARHGGIGTYVRGLSDRLPEALDATTELVTVGVRHRGADPGSVRCEPPIYSLREQVWFRALARRHPSALFHAPNLNAPLRWPGPLVVTVHDLAHIRCPAAARRRGAGSYVRWMLRRVARRADAMVCPSEHSRDDLIDFVPRAEGRCHVVPHGVETSLTPPPHDHVERVLSRLGLCRGYVLYLGAVRPHKNVDALIRAWTLMGERRPELVLAGADQMPRGWAGRGLDGVRLLGVVEDADRSALYGGCAVFCFPSLFEGFGLPPLEAMRCGAPVVCSHATALSEVAGEGALLVDASDPARIAEALTRVCTDDDERARLVERGRRHAATFSWDRAAARTVDVYRAAAAHRAQTAG